MTKITVGIYQCPHCGEYYHGGKADPRSVIHRSYFVGEGRSQYSDGLIPSRFYKGIGISESKCGKFFLHTSHRVANMDAGTGMVYENQDSSKSLNIEPLFLLNQLEIHNFDLFLTSTFWEKAKKEPLDRKYANLSSSKVPDEIIIRLTLWQMYNSLTHHLYPGDEEIQKKIQLEYEEQNHRNLEKLDLLLANYDRKNHLLRAEVKRHLKQNKESRRLLLKVPLDDAYLVKQIRKRIRTRVEGSFEFKDLQNTPYLKLGRLTERLRKGFGIG